MNKPELKISDLENMTWADVIRYYKPTATDAECDYILWNETCHPFDTEITLKQIAELLNSDQKASPD